MGKFSYVKFLKFLDVKFPGPTAVQKSTLGFLKPFYTDLHSILVQHCSSLFVTIFGEPGW